MITGQVGQNVAIMKEYDQDMEQLYNHNVHS